MDGVGWAAVFLLSSFRHEATIRRLRYRTHAKISEMHRVTVMISRACVR
jgi:hypothetical protein